MHNIKLSPIKAQKKSDAAYQILFEKIISKTFSPGQRLDLAVIETQLGISRMPLRLALHRLEHEGLIEIIPQSGTFVTNPSIKNIADSFDIRIILECYAIELAIKRITDQDIAKLQSSTGKMENLISAENWDSIYQSYLHADANFHKELALISGNRRLLKALEHENTHVQSSRILFNYPKDDLIETVNEHNRIISGLSKKDASKTKAEMCAHLDRVKKYHLAKLMAGKN